MNTKKLNPKIWDDGHLIPEIREKLMEIAAKIMHGLEISFKRDPDLFFTGSLAGYHWKPQSDIDLHIIIKPDDEDQELLEYYLKEVSQNWNNNHLVFIKGYKVEVNLKLEETLLQDKGVYDIRKKEWVQEPSLSKITRSQRQQIEKLFNHFKEKIKTLIYDDRGIDRANSIRKSIKKLRVDGLAEDGEYSVGNLVFKKLRHTGFLSHLYDYISEKEDLSLSLEFLCQKNKF